jgi:hypothetical protein
MDGDLMDTSNEIGKLATALAKAQSHYRNVEADAVNPHFKSKFATLAACINATRKPLTDQGLSVVQMPEATERQGVVALSTTILHSSGEWLRSTYEIPQGIGKGPQAHGSAYTYARRYAYCAAVGLGVGDDDGEAAEGSRETEGQRTKRQEAHHASWEGERGAFCAKLGDLSLSYEAVKHWAITRGDGSPSTWPQKGRTALLSDLRKSPSPQHAAIRDVQTAMEAGR